MDNSSRNIVIFIATITFAALLIMAARFYAEAQKQPAPPTVEEAKQDKTEPPAEQTDDPALEGEELEEGEELPEEEDFPAMGEPTINLEQENGPASDAAAPQPQQQQQPMPGDAPVQGYEANN